MSVRGRIRMTRERSCGSRLMVAQRLGDKEDGFFVIESSSTSFEMTDPTNRRMVPRTSVEVYKVETRTAAVTSITNHMTSGGASNPRTPAKQDWRFVGRYEKAEQSDKGVTGDPPG